MKLTSKHSLIASLVGSLFFGCLIFLHLKPTSTTFYFDDQAWGLKTEVGQLILAHTADSQNIEYRLFPAQWSRPNVTALETLQIGTNVVFTSNIDITKLSPSLYKITAHEDQWLYFGKNYQTFPVDQAISSESDYWILSASASVPADINPPKKGIIHLSNRAPNKALTLLLSETGTPLINLQNKEFLFIKWTDNQWQIQTTSAISKNN